MANSILEHPTGNWEVSGLWPGSGTGFRDFSLCRKPFFRNPCRVGTGKKTRLDSSRFLTVVGQRRPIKKKRMNNNRTKLSKPAYWLFVLCFRRRAEYESFWSAFWWPADNVSDCRRVHRYVLCACSAKVLPLNVPRRIDSGAGWSGSDYGKGAWRTKYRYTNRIPFALNPFLNATPPLWTSETFNRRLNTHSIDGLTVYNIILWILIEY